MQIRAVKHAVPGMAVTNKALVEDVLRRNAHFLPDEREAVVQRLTDLLESSGARQRFHRADDERAIDFTIAAARSALDAAGIAPVEIDLLIFVGVGRGFVEPATASVLQSALGLTRATCFDVLDACASWLRALEISHLYIRAGRAQNVLVVNCEFNCREYVQYEMESPRALDLAWAGFTIGEAATATVVSASDDDSFVSRFASAGDFSDLCSIPLPHARQFITDAYQDGHPPLRFYADSRRLHYHGVQLLAEQFLADEHARHFDYDIIFGHSASVPASLAVADRLRLDIRRHYEIFPDYGNTVSASLPLAMSLAASEGRLNRGDRVLLLVASAGITTGYATLTF